MMVVQTATPRPCEVLTSSGPSAPPMVTGTLPALHHCHAATPSGEDIVALVLYFAASLYKYLWYLYSIYVVVFFMSFIWGFWLIDTSTSTNIGLYIEWQWPSFASMDACNLEFPRSFYIKFFVRWQYLLDCHSLHSLSLQSLSKWLLCCFRSC